MRQRAVDPFGGLYAGSLGRALGTSILCVNGIYYWCSRFFPRSRLSWGTNLSSWNKRLFIVEMMIHYPSDYLGITKKVKTYSPYSPYNRFNDARHVRTSWIQLVRNVDSAIKSCLQVEYVVFTCAMRNVSFDTTRPFDENRSWPYQSCIKIDLFHSSNDEVYMLE